MSPRPSESLPKNARLRRRGEFIRAQEAGKRYRVGGFTVVIARREGEHTRLGITVSSRVAGAVGRNRIRRVVREVFRRNRHLFPTGSDLVVIARAGSVDATLTYARFETELRGAARRWGGAS